MSTSVRIGLVGDYNESVVAHRAIPVALQLVAGAIGVDVAGEWIGTEQIDTAARLAGLDGIWCVPASPYRSMAGALLAIRHARTQRLPFFGSCGGFQHAVIEYARDVLLWPDAEHAETSPGAQRSVISPLQCSLVEVTGGIRLQPGSRIANAYGMEEIAEGYHCSYGINPQFQAALTNGPMRATGHDTNGDIRAIELDAHPFFVATLFQPERAAANGKTPPLVKAFVLACVDGKRAR